MAARALPGIEPDMMVLAASRDESGLCTVALRQLEAEHITVETESAIEIGNLQIHMADPWTVTIEPSRTGVTSMPIMGTPSDQPAYELSVHAALPSGRQAPAKVRAIVEFLAWRFAMPRLDRDL